jgi:hypothetical protein
MKSQIAGDGINGGGVFDETLAPYLQLPLTALAVDEFKGFSESFDQVGEVDGLVPRESRNVR